MTVCHLERHSRYVFIYFRWRLRINDVSRFDSPLAIHRDGDHDISRHFKTSLDGVGGFQW